MASRRTGLSPHVIRVWEKRYGAVVPQRTPTNRRLYSNDEIERLSLLRQATELGHSIGNIATLGTDQLREVVAGTPTAVQATKPPHKETRREELMERSLDAIGRLDTQGLENALREGCLSLGTQGLLHKLAAPLAQRMGDLWQAGEITAAQEHFASAVLRVFLGNLARPYAVSDTAPTLLVATPTGQLHELGAALVSCAAMAHGWRVTYLGVGLPAAEIAGAAVRNRARAVALSVVYPRDDTKLPGELEDLRRYLPAEIGILVGGRAASAYSSTLDQIGAIRTNGLETLYEPLDELRGPIETS